MVEICEVEQEIASLISSQIYPDPTSGVSVPGFDVKICRGWPQESELGSDLMSSPGVGWITVNQKSGSAKDKTRYNRGWYKSGNDPDFGLTVVNSSDSRSVTFKGTAQDSGVAGVVIDNVAYPVVVTAGQTAELIVQAISAHILAVGVVEATCQGATLSVPASHTTYGRAAGTVTSYREMLRSEQCFTVSVFAPSVTMRDALEQCVVAALAEGVLTGLDARQVGILTFQGREISDANLNANLYRLDLTWKTEVAWVEEMKSVPTLWPFGVVNSEWAFGIAGTKKPDDLPPVGAIRFDAWYDMQNTIDQQCAAVLSPEKWHYRLPANTQIEADGTANWSVATQDTIDQEIDVAVAGGLSFWAFDSYLQTDTLSLALSLYLSSKKKSSLKFCMIGQSTNWADTSSADGYSSALKRDLSLMSDNDYMTVLGGRPVYFVLDGSASQLADLPAGFAGAISYIRSVIQGNIGKNPYVIYLSGAAFSDYDNTSAAQAVGADAAGAYCTPRLTGAPQPYSALVQAAETDWKKREASGFPMIPTAMTGWDQRPLIEKPQSFYPISSALSDENYYEAGETPDIAAHIMNMTRFLQETLAAPASLGLVYAWNEFAEGGWLAPTYSSDGGDKMRLEALGSDIEEATRESVFPDVPFVTRG